MFDLWQRTWSLDIPQYKLHHFGQNLSYKFGTLFLHHGICYMMDDMAYKSEKSAGTQLSKLLFEFSIRITYKQTEKGVVMISNFVSIVGFGASLINVNTVDLQSSYIR